MAMPIDRKAYYEKRYPHGTVIELTEPIDDEFTPKPKGARFKVDFVDDSLQLHGKWLPPERGGLAVIPEVDRFKIVK